MKTILSIEPFRFSFGQWNSTRLNKWLYHVQPITAETLFQTCSGTGCVCASYFQRIGSFFMIILYLIALSCYFVIKTNSKTETGRTKLDCADKASTSVINLPEKQLRITWCSFFTSLPHLLTQAHKYYHSKQKTTVTKDKKFCSVLPNQSVSSLVQPPVVLASCAVKSSVHLHCSEYNSSG